MTPSRRADAVNAALLGLAIASLFAFNYVVDPFALNRTVDLGLVKEPVALPLSYYDWKVAEYAHVRAPNVILGDSRGGKIPADRVTELLGAPAYNFAYGGGTLADMVSTFWYCAETAPLEHVLMAFGFNLLDGDNVLDRAKVAIEGRHDPLSYYMSPFTTQASVQVLLYNRTGTNLADETPPMAKDEFWRYQLDTGARNNFASYVYPQPWLDELGRIAAWCREHDVRLDFVLVPTHVDLQARIGDFGLTDEYARVKGDLAAIAPLTDLDVPDAYTRDAANFTDPYHFRAEDGARIADAVYRR